MPPFPSICGRLKDGRECGQRDSLRGPELAPSLSHSGAQKPALEVIIDRAGSSHLLSLFLSLPLFPYWQSWDHLVIVSSLRCFSLFTRLDVKRRWCSSFFLLPRLTYIREATWKRPQPGLQQWVPYLEARCQEIICCTPLSWPQSVHRTTEQLLFYALSTFATRPSALLK